MCSWRNPALQRAWRHSPGWSADQGRPRRHSQRKESDYLPHQEVQSQRSGAPAVSGTDELCNGRDA